MTKSSVLTRNVRTKLMIVTVVVSIFFFQAEDGIRDYKVTGVQTCALPISSFVPGVESIEMLEETVRALVVMDYPHDRGSHDHVELPRLWVERSLSPEDSCQGVDASRLERIFDPATALGSWSAGHQVPYVPQSGAQTTAW